MSLKDLVDQIKIKDRDKVAVKIQDSTAQARAWLQEHGEWALVVGVLVGVIFVLFFKLIIVLLVVGGLASYLIWELSSPPVSREEPVVQSKNGSGALNSEQSNDDSSRSDHKN